MSPIEYIKRTTEAFTKQGFPPYKWIENADCPYWTPLAKPLEECRVALLSTGGMYMKDKQQPFNPDRDDLTFREIPISVDVKTLAISHNSYNHTDAEKDMNCILPIERLLELEKKGYIGEFVPIAYSIMGRIFRRTALQQELAPQILQKLRDVQADILILTPA